MCIRDSPRPAGVAIAIKRGVCGPRLRRILGLPKTFERERAIEIGFGDVHFDLDGLIGGGKRLRPVFRMIPPAGAREIRRRQVGVNGRVLRRILRGLFERRDGPVEIAVDDQRDA